MGDAGLSIARRAGLGLASLMRAVGSTVPRQPLGRGGPPTEVAAGGAAAPRSPPPGTGTAVWTQPAPAGFAAVRPPAATSVGGPPRRTTTPTPGAGGVGAMRCIARRPAGRPLSPCPRPACTSPQGDAGDAAHRP